ncbi:MAG: exodeoxyribonuclease VII large subunit [Candidatus Omnitrophica bacterium]|nr:exodeoxyribonuclease VII large subunit [Candidatus Omnitrophota bacterium]
MSEQLTQRQIFTVSQVTQDIKIILENSFPEIWVEGEVSNFSKQPSGHLYFSLKDASAVLDAAMFSRANRDLKFQIENGLKVICFGKISNYGPRSKYNLIVEKIEPKGIGSLQLALEQLKQKLEKEGLFAPEHKRAIPYLPSRIGIVTSLQGAAIKDILKVVDRRFSDLEIIINSVQVQGDAAKEEIAQAILDLNVFNERLPTREQIEVMIVGRGGGSIEDLWAFNEEIVARAIYHSKIPVISAVGHERDWTIADLVADLRAPTPSVAAELVVPKKEDLKEKLEDLTRGAKRAFLEAASNFNVELDNFFHRLNLSMQNILKISENELESARKKISLLNPAVLIQQYKERAEDLAKQIYMQAQHFLKLREAQFRAAIEKLSSLSPLGILARGYSITFKIPDGSIVKDTKAIKAGDRIKTKLHQGEVLSRVTEVN